MQQQGAGHAPVNAFDSRCPPALTVWTAMFGVMLREHTGVIKPANTAERHGRDGCLFGTLVELLQFWIGPSLAGHKTWLPRLTFVLLLA